MPVDLIELDSSDLWTDSDRAALLRRELGRDIGSAAFEEGRSDITGGPTVDAGRFVGRPTVLRRLGPFLAGLLPPTVDRLVASGPSEAALAAAVSLAAGVPFAMVDPTTTDGARQVSGDLHAAEQVVLLLGVIHAGRDVGDVVGVVSARGARVTTVLAVIDLDDAGPSLREAGLAYQPLFHLTDLTI